MYIYVCVYVYIYIYLCVCVCVCVCVGARARVNLFKKKIIVKSYANKIRCSDEILTYNFQNTKE